MNQNSNISTSGTDKATRALEATVTSSATELTREAKHIAGDLAGQAKKSAEAQISGRKDRAAQGLGGLADALRQTGDNMKSQEEENALTEYVVRASDKVEEASRYLERRTLGQIIGDVEGFARREPALFLGGAFVVGLLGGRFLKSSRPAPRTQRSGGMQPANGNRQMQGQGGSPRQLERGESKSTQGAQGQGGQSKPTQGQGAQSKDKPADAGKPTPGMGGSQKPGAV